MSKKRLISFMGISFMLLPMCVYALFNNVIIPTHAEAVLNFEAEAGVIKGTSSSDNPSDPFIVDAEATGSRATSGGQAVEYMGTKGNEIRWGLVADNATTCDLSMYICVCSAYNDLSSETHLGLYLNGEEISWDQDSLPAFKGDPNWYTWEEITAEGLEFEKGNNTLTIINKSGFNVNFDNFTLSVTDSTGIELDNSVIDDSKIEYESGGGGSGQPGGNDDTSNAIIFEAEKGKIEGTNTSINPGDGFIVEATGTGKKETSGSKCVENWAAAGNTITWKIDVSAATKNSGLSLYLSNCTASAITISNNISFTVNGNEVPWNETEIAPMDGPENFYTWQEISADGFDLKKGTNILVLTNVSGVNVNVDDIVLYVPMTVSMELLGNSEKPTITNFAFITATADIKTNNPVEFSFVAADDVTTADKLQISVRVFYNFGQADQAKMTVKTTDNGYSFTPTKLGTYTVVIKVTDDDSQTVQETPTLEITAEGVKENKPSGNNGTSVTTKTKMTTLGIVLLCVSVVCIGGLATYVIIKRKRMLKTNEKNDGGNK